MRIVVVNDRWCPVIYVRSRVLRVESINHIEGILRGRSLVRVRLQQSEIRRRVIGVVAVVIGKVVSGVVGDNILNKVHAAAVKLPRQPLIISQRSKVRIYLFKIDGPIPMPTSRLVG